MELARFTRSKNVIFVSGVTNVRNILANYFLLTQFHPTTTAISTTNMPYDKDHKSKSGRRPIISRLKNDYNQLLIVNHQFYNNSTNRCRQTFSKAAKRPLDCFSFASYPRIRRDATASGQGFAQPPLPPPFSSFSSFLS